MDKDMKSKMVVAVAGALMGYISFILAQKLVNTMYIFFISMIVMVATLFLNAKFVAKKNFRLKFDKDMTLFLLFWFVVWAIFFNIGLYS
ncbi:MAG: hypothetical protein B6U68_03480 [Candidatus Aenigmarchaeota archaeon ex4484_14]|nr:MAG: hypothetical protein B6U68_03480 [Candidatus Aenigmarchaeota archaeon ex4484_14]